ncbi:MAG: xylulose kinase [Kiritimatiellae bacterium]|nr:xylulose kinase [Kiritimatiellia bacterium]MDD5521024.1 xylulose kinase [Kiritimatiellia bacterium]
MSNKKRAKYFLGLDSSTQSLKATIIDSHLKVVNECSVNFDSDLPKYKTTGGVHRGKDGLTVTAPAIMWVEALDLLFQKLRKQKVPLGKVAAIAGSGQQHGSVWLKKGTLKILKSLTPSRTLKEQLKNGFSVEDSPIWMDSSTTKQCAQREKAMGGPQAVADITGSRAYERFTGNQIAKIYQKNRIGYNLTERIALVSSFIPTLLIGDYAPIDVSDGSGMNLMDIRSRKWSKKALDCTAPGLSTKLGKPELSHKVAGKIHLYFVEKYGFNTDCLIIVFSGDNPNSLAGLHLQRPGDIAVSLGTSDTVFGFLSKPVPSASEGHIFVNPVDPKAYMALVCYKNGSLTREYVRNGSASGSWEKFNSYLRQGKAGNDGNIGFYVKEPEITPPILTTGISRYDSIGRRVKSFPPATEVRAVIEGQFLSMRLHGENIGLKARNILATGGASANKEILKIMANVFGVPVYIAKQTSSASLGAAYRALHGWICSRSGKFVPYARILSSAPPFKKAAVPDKKAFAVYTSMLKKYAVLENKMMVQSA